MLGVMLKPNRPQIQTRSDTCQATMTKDQVQNGGILYSPTHDSWDLPDHQLLIPKAQILCCESVAGCIHCYSHLFLSLLLHSHVCLACKMLCLGSCKLDKHNACKATMTEQQPA